MFIDDFKELADSVKELKNLSRSYQTFVNVLETEKDEIIKNNNLDVKTKEGHEKYLDLVEENFKGHFEKNDELANAFKALTYRIIQCPKEFQYFLQGTETFLNDYYNVVWDKTANMVCDIFYLHDINLVVRMVISIFNDEIKSFEDIASLAIFVSEFHKLNRDILGRDTIQDLLNVIKYLNIEKKVDLKNLFEKGSVYTDVDEANINAIKEFYKKYAVKQEEDKE